MKLALEKMEFLNTIINSKNLKLETDDKKE